ncbi:hypothetical protein GQ602_001117 [Ophiocordyceps camponoti-floridani]|uniref:Uncharacterized protein n=1 Tax=Ophiocordyceps camponoti-floridani TaxID=2030778 RepID=A0A8H4QDE1_9HYPO|nr:hypothetical protein GQ602_001117 [Ophiocordyceps camponoti-floridani]
MATRKTGIQALEKKLRRIPVPAEDSPFGSHQDEEPEPPFADEHQRAQWEMDMVSEGLTAGLEPEERGVAPMPGLSCLSSDSEDSEDSDSISDGTDSQAGQEPAPGYTDISWVLQDESTVANPRANPPAAKEPVQTLKVEAPGYKKAVLSYLKCWTRTVAGSVHQTLRATVLANEAVTLETTLTCLSDAVSDRLFEKIKRPRAIMKSSVSFENADMTDDSFDADAENTAIAGLEASLKREREFAECNGRLGEEHFVLVDKRDLERM